jgi:DNA-binding response OmpR family regulator
VVLTTRGDAASRTAAIDAGASLYMTKPFVPATLARSVESVLALAGTRPATGRP